MVLGKTLEEIDQLSSEEITRWQAIDETLCLPSPWDQSAQLCQLISRVNGGKKTKLDDWKPLHRKVDNQREIKWKLRRIARRQNKEQGSKQGSKPTITK